ncbi:hypothetical protein CBS101457_000462 [Exobasidium rhododendri]|nr:hypothetical protein CBS101457_000462 [Exobasidium rhododendri]
MMRTAIQNTTSALERSSRLCLPSGSRHLHSSAPNPAHSTSSSSASSSSDASRPTLTPVQIQQLRKEREQKREITRRLYELSKPDPVLGHQMNEIGEKLWKSSELCSIILTKDEVWGVREDRRGNLLNVEEKEEKSLGDASFPGPKRVNFGLDTEEDRRLLFSDLPSVKLEDRLRNAMDPTMASEEELASLSDDMQHVVDQESLHADILSRVLDLKNASGKGIQVENTRRIVDRFGARLEGDERGPDTGSVECQAAVLTYRIRNLQEHLQSDARHDNQNRRSMTLLVHQRAKLLKYLKRKSASRYKALLPRIGVEARAVEGEIVVPGKPRLQIAT